MNQFKDANSVVICSDASSKCVSRGQSLLAFILNFRNSYELSNAEEVRLKSYIVKNKNVSLRVEKCNCVEFARIQMWIFTMIEESLAFHRRHPRE
jgi:hypothetical protein